MAAALQHAKTFHRALARLQKDEQTAVKEAVYDYIHDPDRPGFQMHRVNNARDSRFWSIRVTRDLRIVLAKDRDATVLLYVGHHDDAYEWAERRRFEVHPTTGALQIVEVVEVTDQRTVPAAAPTRDLAFAGESDEYLLSLGVPPTWLPRVKSVTVDEVADLLVHLPEEAGEALLSLATGDRPEPRPVGGDPYAHPDTKRRLWVASDEASLRQALDAPWTEWLTFLHPLQREAVEKPFGGPARIAGGPGTGKSVVAIHKAAALARSGSGGQVLLTTYSSILAARLRAGLDLLVSGSDAQKQVHVAHLHRLAVELLRRSPAAHLSPVPEEEIDRLLAAHAGLQTGTDLAVEFLRAEWDAVIDYWGVRQWPDYRDVQRAGRVTRLSAGQRESAWRVFEAVQQELTARKLGTWGDIVDAARLVVEAGAEAPYRHVIVDEAQDFGPRELRFIRALAPLAKRDLFLVGDVGQTIYRWPFSWLSAGVDVRGRGTRLKLNYRTTAQIKTFADRILPRSLVAADDQDEQRKSVSLLSGPEPEVQQFSSVSDEATAVAKWLREMVAGGIPPEQIAVLGRTRALVNDRGGRVVALADLTGHRLWEDGNEAKGSVCLSTVHGVKGLEFRAVAVVGCETENFPHLAEVNSVASADARNAVLARERSLLYVALTRPRDMMLVTSVGQPTPFGSISGNLPQ